MLSRIKKKGLLFVISAPSGAGKTTLVNMITQTIPDLRLSISHTTRKPRPDEADGTDYYFVSHDRFRKMIGQGDFIEWAEVFGNYYGTSYKTIDDTINRKQDILLDIDVQGAEQLREKCNNGCYIFVLPPSIATLRKRLRERGGDSDSEIKKRTGKAEEEIRHYKHYDYTIINEELTTSARQLESIIIAERCRYPNVVPELPDMRL